MEFEKHTVVDVELATGMLFPHFVSAIAGDEEWMTRLPVLSDGSHRVVIDDEVAEHGEDFLSKFQPKITNETFDGWEPRPDLVLVLPEIPTLSEIVEATVHGVSGTVCVLEVTDNLLVDAGSVDEDMGFTLDGQGQATIRLKLTAPGSYTAVVHGGGRTATQTGRLQRVAF